MKKNEVFSFKEKRFMPIDKIMKIMKVLTFIMLVCVVHVSARSYSQNTKLSMKMQKVSIKQVLSKIEDQSEYRFLYSDSKINVEKIIDVDFNNKPVEEILRNMFENSNIQFTVAGRQILLSNSAESVENIQQQKSISGKVTDQSGIPIPGASILVKGTTLGTITNSEGNFSLPLPSDAKVLVFSFVGMKSQEIVFAGKTSVNIVLEDVSIGIEDVIIVGYGTQKKINITGSVSNISSDALGSKSVTKGSLGLVGEMSGVSVRQLSGNPKDNAAQIRIRGLGTFSGAGNNPLILVDGIEASLDNVDPNDINSVSVLKDAASASIYGSKAANGVILVETKKGIAGTPKFNFYSYVGKQTASDYPQMLDSWDYAAAINEFNVNGGQAKRFTDEDIQKFKSGTDPAYPNFNHMKNLWTSGSGLQTKQGMSVSGGTPGTQYLFSAGYLDHAGLVMKNYNKRYDMRLNLKTKFKKNVNFIVNLSGNTANANEPSGAYDQGIGVLTRGALRMTNNRPGPTSDGYWGFNETIHPEADMNSKSFVKNKNSYFSGNTELNWNFHKNFKISGKAGYTYGISQTKFFRATYPVSPTYSVSPNTLTDSWYISTLLTLQSLIEYNKTLGNHFIHLLGGFEQQQNDFSYIRAYRDAFPNNEIYEIDAGTTTRGTQGGNASRNKLRSFLGRGNYSYLDKYLIEGNVRYDGSSRFPEDNRYGIFPSFSAGWRVSKENFFQNALPWINDLKLRGSWGELGNQSVGDYPYQSLISLGQNYPFGNSLTAGAAVTTLPNKEITWERTKMTDAGIDLSVMDGKFSLTADYFVKTTSGILYNISASSMLGASPSLENAGSVENKGWDFELSHKNNIGGFSYSVSANFSLNNNKVTSLANVKLDIAKGLFVGYPIGSRYGFIADGLFVDQADIQSYVTQPFAAQPGDIRYKDISGPEGVPDGKVDNTYDRTVIGSPLPTSTYGLNLTAKYKGFDLALLFQGEGGRKEMIKSWHSFAYEGDGNIQQWQYQQRWTTENPDRNAGYPGFITKSNGFYSSNPSSFWFKDATFIRLKNIQIGYSLPTEFTKKLSLDKVRIYFNGENLFTLSNFYEGWDPEMSINDSYGWYPLTKLFLGGISIDF